MDIRNYYAFVGCILLSLGVLLELLTIPELIKQLLRPKDGWTRLRQYVLARPVVYVLTFTPFVVLLAQRSFILPQTRLGSFVQVSVPFGLLFLAIFTYLSYTYKERK